MKLNIIKLLITTLLFISAAFAFELIIRHLAYADAVIDPQIRFKRGELGNIHLGGQELLVIGIMIVPALLVYLGGVSRHIEEIVTKQEVITQLTYST